MKKLSLVLTLFSYLEKIMKVKSIFSLSLLLPFAMIFIYVWYTSAEVPFRDDMYLIKGGFIESYCKGTLTFADLWRPSASARILGYALIQLANIKLFGMKSRMIVMLIPLLMLGSAVLIYLDYRKSLLGRLSPQFIAATFVLLSLTIFNLVLWEGLTFSYGFVFQSPMPFFIAGFISMQLFLAKGEAKYWPAAFILPVLAILIFGGTHSFSFAPALSATLICYILTRRNSLSKEFWLRVVIIGLFLAMLAFLYMYRIHYNDYFPNSSGHHLDKALDNPSGVVQFLLAAFGASVVGVNAANIYFSFHSMVVLGFCVIIIYCLCGYLFFASKLYERTYLPFYLMMQTLFYLIFMMIARFDYGIDYGMASRYTCVSVYGLAGIIWVIIFFLANSEDLKPRWRVLLYVPIVMIFSGIFLTAIVEWRIQPYRKAYYQNIKDIALRVDTATVEELSKFQEKPTLVRQSLMILRDCHLNVYGPSSVDRN
ncbi:MAG: hypothetical protein CVU55_13330 [Deltaproteobacteria bacterium HGW-Deltaproteobacteria-13]|nr:MAG: hypothetical protein CVU55_13330 [Deltaproteobacteria bacterium HGW-Deltaproteobacteria-13]